MPLQQPASEPHRAWSGQFPCKPSQPCQQAAECTVQSTQGQRWPAPSGSSFSQIRQPHQAPANRCPLCTHMSKDPEQYMCHRTDLAEKGEGHLLPKGQAEYTLFCWAPAGRGIRPLQLDWCHWKQLPGPSQVLPAGWFTACCWTARGSSLCSQCPKGVRMPQRRGRQSAPLSRQLQQRGAPTSGTQAFRCVG